MGSPICTIYSMVKGNNVVAYVLNTTCERRNYNFSTMAYSIEEVIGKLSTNGEIYRYFKDETPNIQTQIPEHQQSIFKLESICESDMEIIKSNLN